MKHAALQADVQAIAAHLRQHARDYYPQADDAALQVRLVRSSQRRFSLLCEFELQAPAWRQTVLAKVTRDGDALAESALLSPVQSRFIAAADRRGAEWAAMSTWAAHVARQADPRLFAVRMLASLCDDRALLMERAAAAPLTKLIYSASRLGGSLPTRALLQALQHAGVALSTLHSLTPSPLRQLRGTRRDDFLAWLAAAEQYFRGDTAAHRFYRQIAPRLRAAALELLPDELPCGPLHNDFAPRNVLIDKQGRVALIDMLDQWTGCVWEDVGHFLASLETNKAQSLTGGRCFSPTAIAAMRRAFLAGYAERGVVDERVLRLFAAQAMLTKWAAELHLDREARGLGKLKRRLNLALASHWYARCIAASLDAATGKTTALATAPHGALVAGGAA